MPAYGELTKKAVLQRYLKILKIVLGAPIISLNLESFFVCVLLASGQKRWHFTKISLSLESILDACVWRMDSKGGTSKTPKDT